MSNYLIINLFILAAGVTLYGVPLWQDKRDKRNKRQLARERRHAVKTSSLKQLTEAGFTDAQANAIGELVSKR